MNILDIDSIESECKSGLETSHHSGKTKVLKYLDLFFYKKNPN